MNKKLAITYTFLFLFVFTFALSFTLTQAEPGQYPICCTVYCEGYPKQVSYHGWWGYEESREIRDTTDPVLVCMPPYNPDAPCFQVTYQCQSSGP